MTRRHNEFLILDWFALLPIISDLHFIHICIHQLLIKSYLFVILTQLLFIGFLKKNLFLVCCLTTRGRHVLEKEEVNVVYCLRRWELYEC